MSKDLVISNKTDLINIVSEKEIGELIKPLMNEIHLFDTYVANTSLLKDKSVLNEINLGDKLSLIRQKSKFDDNEIAIFTESKKRVGNIPEKDNLVFARLLEAGKSLIAKINKINHQEGFVQISIGIFLQDF